MIRNLGTWILMISLTILIGGGCSKKSKPSEVSETPTEAPVSDVQDTDLRGDQTGFDGSLSSLPVIYFDFDNAVLSSQGRTLLQQVAQSLKGVTENYALTIEGHCDERGSNEYNLALGERRGQAVKRYLQQLGVASSRLSAISYGEERPADMGSGEAAWAKNRRAELVLKR